MIKDVVYEKLKSIRDFNVNEIPSRIWRHQERDEVFAIYSTSVIKICLDSEKTIFSVQTGKIVFSAVFDDLIYIVVETAKIWTIYRLESGVAVGRPTKIFESEEEIKWILVLKGDQIKPTFFEENKLKSDFATNEVYVFVGGQSPCLVYRDVSYQLHPFPATPLSYQLHPFPATPLSRPEFIIKYTQCISTLKVEKFSQILNLLEPQTESGFLLPEEIKEIILHSHGTVVLLKNGDLKLYTAAGRRNILEKVVSCTVYKDTVSACTDYLGLYTASIKELNTFDCNGLDEDKEKYLVSGAETLSSIFTASRCIQDTGIELAKEKIKLNQIQLFSKVSEGTTLFSTSISVQQNQLVNSYPSIKVDLTWQDPEEIIHQNFFALKVCLKTKTWNFIKVFKLKQMRLNQTFSVSLPLPDLELTHLPIQLSVYLALLEEKVGYLGQHFLFSKSIFQQEISPFSFISLRLSPVSTSCSIAGLTGGGSEQTSFLSLLDPDQSELKRKLRKKIKLDTQKIENNLESILVGLIKEPNQGKLFTFFNQEISIEWRVCEEKGEEGCIYLVSTCPTSLNIFSNYLSKFSPAPSGI